MTPARLVKKKLNGDGNRYVATHVFRRMRHTLPETNIAPTNGWLEYYFPIGEAYFHGLR